MNKICLSSELYKVSINDIKNLDDCENKYNKNTNNEVIVLIGKKDTLLAGRQIVEEAIKNNIEFVPVRIAFVSVIKDYDFVSPFIRSLRMKNRVFSSNVYHVPPKEIRKIKIERNIRTAKNAYIFTNPKFYFAEDERKKQYSELYNSMKKGYNDEFPLDVMLLRMMGVKDTINQGHHRMGIAIEHNLPYVTIRFAGSGEAPKILKPLLKIIAKININLKLRNKK